MIISQRCGMHEKAVHDQINFNWKKKKYQNKWVIVSHLFHLYKYVYINEVDSRITYIHVNTMHESFQ